MSPLASEINGRRVLDIYSHFKSRPGHALRANNFIAVAARTHVRIADVQSGIDFATSAGWIEEEPDGSLRLTQTGFQQMQSN